MTEMIERFEEKYIPEPNSGCWLWVGSASSNGKGGLYGFLRNENGKMERAHRISFRLFDGEIGEGQMVRHVCDNPSCVNPAHLLAGTAKDNVADRDRRGRSVNLRGEAHGRSKLTEDDVREIRIRAANKEAHKSIGKDFGVSQFGVRYAIKGWRHVE